MSKSQKYPLKDTHTNCRCNVSATLPFTWARQITCYVSLSWLLHFILQINHSALKLKMASHNANFCCFIRKDWSRRQDEHATGTLAEGLLTVRWRETGNSGVEGSKGAAALGCHLQGKEIEFCWPYDKNTISFEHGASSAWMQFRTHLPLCAGSSSDLPFKFSLRAFLFPGETYLIPTQFLLFILQCIFSLCHIF